MRSVLEDDRRVPVVILFRHDKILIKLAHRRALPFLIEKKKKTRETKVQRKYKLSIPKDFDEERLLPSARD